MVLYLLHRRVRAARLASQGNYTEALFEQRKAAELDPDGDAIQYALAQLYAQTGEYFRAMMTLLTAIELQPRYGRKAATNPAFEELKQFAEFRRLVGIDQP